MARKQKKLTRKERQQQQQEAVARRRTEKGWIPPHQRPQQYESDLAEDLEPILDLMQSGPNGSEMEALMMLLTESESLADEPEFEDIFADPLLTVTTYIQTAEQMGLTPDDISKLAEEEREDTLSQVFEDTVRQVLTDDLREEIINALDNLRQRLRQAGQRQEAAKAAALQSFLSTSEVEDAWLILGLVQTIVGRALEAGFKLMELTEKMMSHLPDNESADTWLQDAAESELGQQIQTELAQIPGLSRFVEKKTDEIMDEGYLALRSGELDLALFTEEELTVGFNIFTEVMGGSEAIEELFEQDDYVPEITQKQSETLIERVNAHLTQILTPERMDEIRDQVEAILEAEDLPKQYYPFGMMMNNYLQDEEDPTTQRLFLITAFLGEMRAVTDIGVDMLDNFENLDGDNESDYF